MVTLDFQKTCVMIALFRDLCKQRCHHGHREQRRAIMEPHEKKRRQKRDKQKARRIDLYPEMQYCPVCGAKLEQSYRSERYMETLEEFFHVVSHACHCPVPGCSFHPGPEASPQLQL